MRGLALLFQELEMREHRMIVGEIEPADHTHRVMPGLNARELDAFVGVEQFAAGELRQEIKMPPGAAEFAIGRELQADRRLLVHDLFDLDVLDLAQIVGRYLALLQFGARLLDARRPQQAADLVGAERSFCSLHVLLPKIRAFSSEVDSGSREENASKQTVWRGARDPQEALEYRGIGLQGGTRRVMDDRAALQYHNAVGQPQNLLRVLLDDDGTGAARAGDGAERSQQFLDDDRGESLGRLVQQQHFWVERQRPADPQHLLLAAG